MKYINTQTKIIVEPPSLELVVLNFSKAPWMPYEKQEQSVEPPKEKSIDKMTTAELTEKASTLGVDISDCKTNAERVAKLTEDAEDGEG